MFGLNKFYESQNYVPSFISKKHSGFFFFYTFCAHLCLCHLWCFSVSGICSAWLDFSQLQHRCGRISLWSSGSLCCILGLSFHPQIKLDQFSSIHEDIQPPSTASLAATDTRHFHYTILQFDSTKDRPVGCMSLHKNLRSCLRWPLLRLSRPVEENAVTRG